LLKIFQKIGPTDQFYLAQDNDGKTKGFGFIEFQKDVDAVTAIQKLDGFVLDKNNTFKAFSYEEFSRAEKVTEKFEPTDVDINNDYIKNYNDKSHLQEYLLDEKVSDQFATKHSSTCEIFWNVDSKEGSSPEKEISRDDWTETFLTWSPQGTYLATVHSKGITLWGQKEWKRIFRVPHSGVFQLDFSPQERYLITISSSFTDETAKTPKALVIWETKTGKKKKSFHSSNRKGLASIQMEL